MEKIVISANETSNTSVQLSEFGDSLEVFGNLSVSGNEPAVLTDGLLNRINVEPPGGVIQAENTAIQVNGVGTNIFNDGTIQGGRNAINLADDNRASASIFNNGTISSGSRAINIGGVGGVVVNNNLIITTANPRNGTIYGDQTAQNVVISNRSNGVVDVGVGNNGDAVSLELGANVNGSLVNSGLLQGRGVAVGTNRSAGVRLFRGDTVGSDVAVFNGNIENLGRLIAENAAAVVLQNGVQLNGSIINSGEIISANPANGIGISLENGSQLAGEIINTGSINGGRDGINFANGGEVSGTVINSGTITSTSRGINIGGNQIKVINDGLITTTGNPRNGTVYSDVTSNNYFIENRSNGVVDVGVGNNGDAVSLELGANVNASLVNSGLLQGRGVAVGTNRSAAVRLFRGDDVESDAVFNGNIENLGRLIAENAAAVVLQNGVQLNGSIINSGEIISANPANGIGISLENGSQLAGEIINTGTINGGRDGINFANGGQVSGTVINSGTITSTSRGINIGGNQIKVINDGLITTTGNPRNGTVYSDLTANNYFIENRSNGVVDVGAGNNGDAVSLELGANVNASLVNSGLLQGRGVAVGTNRSAAVRLFRGDDVESDAVFNGDIDNSGTLVAENNAAVVIQANVQLNGSIINTGTIEGGAFNNGKLAIDASNAVLSVRVNNQGTINGDVLLSAGNDIYNSNRGTTNGTVEGGAGDDILSGGDGNYTLNGGDGNDFLSGRSGTHFFVGGKGDDTIDLTRNQGIDTVVYNSGDGRDTVNNFTQGVGGDLLSFTDTAEIDVVVNGSSTWFRISDRLQGNNGFGTGDVLLALNGTTGFTADNIGANLASTNKANFLFA